MIGDILLARLAAIPQVELPQTSMGFNAFLPQDTLVEAPAVVEVQIAETEIEAEHVEDMVELPLELPLPMLPSLPMGIALRMAETPMPVQEEPLPLIEQEQAQLPLPELDDGVYIAPQPATEPKIEIDTEGEVELETVKLPLEMPMDVAPKLPPKVAAEQEQPPLQSKPAEHKAIEKIQIAAAPAPEPMPLSLSLDSQSQPEALVSEVTQVIEFEPLVEKREVQPAQKASLPPLVRNVMERMETLHIEPGKTKVLLRPDGLGTLEIDLSQAADGQMQLVIRVENPMVLDALRQESTHLANFMGAKGFDLAGGEPQLDHYEAEKKQSKDEGDDLVEDEDVEVNQHLGADSLNIMT